MPQRNKQKQNVGVIGGDSASLNTQFENSLRGVPDVKFSDTSFPVLADQFQVVGTWNMPITGLSDGDINQFWSIINPNVAGGAETFTSPPAGASLELILDQTNPRSNFYVAIVFPKGKHGRLRVEVNKKSVVSFLDNRTLGPPNTRSFEIEFDTRPDVPLPNLRPALLTLNKPLIATWKSVTWRQYFYFTSPVSGFTEDDINVSANITKGTLIPDSEDNRVYYMDMTLPSNATGTYEITIDPNIVKSGGSDEENSPPAEVSETWAFDTSKDISDLNGLDIDGVEILCRETYPITNHPELEHPTDGGSFLGIGDMKVFNGRVYLTSQIQRKRERMDLDEVSLALASAGALSSVPVGGGTCQIHKKYQFFRQAARSPVLHPNRFTNEDELYYFEGSAYIYAGSKTHPNFTLNNVGKGLGNILKVLQSGGLSDIGLNFRSEFPTGSEDRYNGEHGGTMCPLVSHDGQLHIISQKYDFYDINGEQWIVYGNKLNQRITLLETNDKTGFSIIENLAGLTNSIIGYEKGQFIFKPRKQTQAYLKTELTETQDRLEPEKPNRFHTWTLSGTLKINDEIISYSGIDNDRFAFTGLKRGLHGTDAKTHPIDSPIVLIDKVVDAVDLSRPINDMDIETDGTIIRNDILTKYAEDQVPRVENLSFPALDEASIKEFGQRKFTLELPLDYHQQRWAVKIAGDYLKRYKDLTYVVKLILKRESELELGDTIYLTEPIIEDIKLLCQVMSITQYKKREETEITLSSITSDS